MLYLTTILILVQHLSRYSSCKCCSKLNILGQRIRHLFHQNLRYFHFGITIYHHILRRRIIATLRFLCPINCNCCTWCSRSRRSYYRVRLIPTSVVYRLHLRRIRMIVFSFVCCNCNRWIIHTPLHFLLHCAARSEWTFEIRSWWRVISCHLLSIFSPLISIFHNLKIHYHQKNVKQLLIKPFIYRRASERPSRTRYPQKISSNENETN